MKMKNKLIILPFFICLTLIGCKKKYEDTFEYKILDKKICAIKNKTVKNANRINWLFTEVRNFRGEVVSGNLKMDQVSQEYLFCANLAEFKNSIGEGPLQTDISIEIDSASSVQEYNLRNYSCVLADRIKLNVSEKEFSETCIN